MSETAIVKEVLIEVCKIPGVRVWRVNTGVAYGSAELAKIALGMNARPVRFGIPGQADISGIIAPWGIRLEIECKTATGRQREEQKNWQRMIEEHGGIYILARSAKEAVEKINNAILQKTAAEQNKRVLPGDLSRKAA